MLRWEKVVDVLCMLREGRMLRNALRSAPRTRFWMYTDLSPDARQVEQCGMGVEYVQPSNPRLFFLPRHQLSMSPDP